MSLVGEQDPKEFTVLSEIWQNVLPHLNSWSRVLEELTDIFYRLMEVRAFDLLLMDDEQQHLHSAASWGVEGPSDKTIAPGEGVCGYVAQTRELCNVSEATQEEHGEEADKGQVYSELAVPLIADDKVLGVIDVKRDGAVAFSRKDEELFSVVAKHTANALNSALHYKQLQARVQESNRQADEQTQELRTERDRANLLYKVAQEMTRTLDLDRVLNRTLARVSQALGVRQASILLLDPESGYLVYRAALGRSTVLPRGGKPTRFRRGIGLAGWVLEHNECAIITGLDRDPRWEVDPEKKGQSQSVLAVPLSSAEQVLGVMLLFHPDSNHFDDDHVWLATAAANHISAAVKNTELYTLVRNQAARLGQMLREQRSIASQRMAILSSIADGVAVCDEYDRVIVVNDAARQITRLTNQELIGQPSSVLFAAFTDQGQQAAYEAMAEITVRPHARQYVEPASILLTRENQVVQTSFAPMLDERQQFSGTVIVFRDVTLEQEMAQAKNVFVSTVAHELRTPLTSIKGYTDLILKGAMGTLTDGQEHFLNIVRSNVDRMSTLVSDLLDISRIEAGRIQLELQPLQLTQIVQEVCDSVAGTIEERELVLDIDPQPDTPTVYADRGRIIQVLTNLLSNAYRYTPAGGSITVSTRPVEGAVLVQVADTGIGISAEHKERIFERFYRVNHPLVNQQAGTGLGLPIVRSLVELHGGKVWLESEPDKGSTFSFTLPLRGKP